MEQAAPSGALVITSDTSKRQVRMAITRNTLLDRRIHDLSAVFLQACTALKSKKQYGIQIPYKVGDELSQRLYDSAGLHTAYSGCAPQVYHHGATPSREDS